ncbi:hypothetical protein GCM10007036_43740 [Alsobacter metallidurans]|uniref:Uncharacterized protein n=1 Tax=Alsobacter metallidurans TaxID=340221 RepID=A0A917IAZ9_9HYPH|nr:hypothetical protein [Alsobacter metallidurans]GGH32111.1 hypothetical protein GCM10007036_43740 [Alsobacter metallidurans]
MPNRKFDPQAVQATRPQANRGRPFRDLAADYVDAVKRGALQPDSELSRLVEERDPAGRFRTLGLAMRDKDQGRMADAVAKLRTLRFSKREVAAQAAEQIAQLSALGESQTGGRKTLSDTTRRSRHGW